MATKRKLSKGMIVQEGDKYFVLVNQVKHELPLSVISQKTINELVGKDVSVEFAEPITSIIGVFGTGSIRPPRILCYVPVPFEINPLIVEEIERIRIAEEVAGELLEKGAISKEIYARLFRR